MSYCEDVASKLFESFAGQYEDKDDAAYDLAVMTCYAIKKGMLSAFFFTKNYKMIEVDRTNDVDADGVMATIGSLLLESKDPKTKDS